MLKPAHDEKYDYATTTSLLQGGGRVPRHVEIAFGASHAMWAQLEEIIGAVAVSEPEPRPEQWTPVREIDTDEACE
jgi:hypothetical protein